MSTAVSGSMQTQFMRSLLCIGCGLLAALPFIDRTSYCIWFSLIPVLYLTASASSKALAWLLGYLFALSWMTVSFWFVSCQTWVGMVVLVFYSSFFYATGFIGIRWFVRRGLWSGVFGAGAVWVCIEWLRASIPVFGFPWALLGHAAWAWDDLKQLAATGGVLLIGYVIFCVNAFLAFGVLPRISDKMKFIDVVPSPHALRNCGAVLSIFLLVALIYGQWRQRRVREALREGPLIALLQGNEPQKFEDRAESIKWRQLQRHIALHAKAAAGDENGERPVLICWAETMVPGRYNLPGYSDTFRACVIEHGIPTLFGSDWLHEEDVTIASEFEQRWYNSAFLVDDQGQLLARYSKIRIVPFGEYIPFKNYLPFLSQLRSITRDSYRPGESHSPIFEIAGVRGAFNICIEDVHPDLARINARAGAQVLFNLTNDGWFAGTSEPQAHLYAAHFRAIETACSLVRVTNTGRSVLVDPTGRIVPVVPPDVEAVGFVRVPYLDPQPITWYMRLGDSGLVLILSVIAGLALWLDHSRLLQVKPR